MCWNTKARVFIMILSCFCFSFYFIPYISVKFHYRHIIPITMLVRQKNIQRPAHLRTDRRYIDLFFKNGTLKATGPFVNEMMQGEWTFYRGNRTTLAGGNFRDNMKHVFLCEVQQKQPGWISGEFNLGKLIKRSNSLFPKQLIIPIFVRFEFIGLLLREEKQETYAGAFKG